MSLPSSTVRELSVDLRLPKGAPPKRPRAGKAQAAFPTNVPRTTPKWIPPTSNPQQRRGAGTSVSDAQGWVEIPQQEFHGVYTFFEDNDLLGAALNKLEDSVTSGGAEVRLTEFDQEVELTDEHTRFVKDEFTKFLRDFQLYKLLFGVVVVRLGESRDYPGEVVPYVVPYSKYRLAFIEGSGLAGRRYYVQ